MTSRKIVWVAESFVDFHSVSKLAFLFGHFTSPKSGPSGARHTCAPLFCGLGTRLRLLLLLLIPLRLLLLLTYKGKVLYLGVSVLSWSRGRRWSRPAGRQRAAGTSKKGRTTSQLKAACTTSFTCRSMKRARRRRRSDPTLYKSGLW